MTFFFLFNTTVSYTQTKRIDSLKNELQHHTSYDTIRVNMLYDIAFASFRNNMDSTKLYLEKAEKLSNTLNYTKGKARILYLRGILENIKSNYAKSLIFFNNSLKHFESIQDVKGIANIYTAFGITHFDQSQYDKSLKAYNKALEIYTDLGNKKEIITILINTANVYSETGRYNKAISNYQKALKLSEATNDEDGVAFVQVNLGVVYTAQGNYSLAAENYNKALNYNQKVNNSSSIAILLMNLGDVYNYLKNYNKAIKYYQESLSISLKFGYKDMIAQSNSNIADIYTHNKEHLKALRYYQSSLEKNQEINDLKETAICFYKIGKVNLLLDKPLIALKNFEKAKDISQKINNKHVLCSSLLGISETYIYQRQYQKAISFIEKSKKISEEQKLLEAQKKATELLSEIYSGTEQYKKAYENHKLFKKLSDSLLNKENIEKITALEYEYKYKNQLESAEKRELTLTKKVKTTTQNLAKSQHNLLLGIIAFLITTLILGAIIFFLKLRNIKSKTQNIVIEQKLLRSQMTPHFIFNSLSVLQGIILNKEFKKSVTYLSKFSKLLRITLENSRDKIVILENELKAIENYLIVQNLGADIPYNYSIEVDENIDKKRLLIPPMMIQPFVENAVEHAFQKEEENKQIDIQLKFEGTNLICIIMDNGIGIETRNNKDSDKEKKSLATTITAERLQMMAKEFKITTNITIEDRKHTNHKGTMVTLTLPYKKD